MTDKPQEVRVLNDLVKREGHKIIFLQETKMETRRVMKLKYKLGFEGGLQVDSEGRKGVLALFWKGEVELTIINYSKHHIHT